MPDDFDVKKHAANHFGSDPHGLVFGTFSDEVPPVDEWLGETMMHYAPQIWCRLNPRHPQSAYP